MPLDNNSKLVYDHSAKMIEHANYITDRQQILKILINVYKNHSLLEANIADHPETFTTTILGLNRKTGLLALDELSPKLGHHLFQEHKSIHLSGRMDGVEMVFELDLIATKIKNNIAYYQASIPDRVIYMQRRSDHRVTLIGSSQFHGCLPKQEDKPIKGYAADISMHGIGVVLNNREEIERGDRITSCELLIPDEASFCFDLEVRYIQRIRKRKMTRFGGQFLKMEKREKNRISKIIRRLERKHAQIVRD